MAKYMDPYPGKAELICDPSDPSWEESHDVPDREAGDSREFLKSARMLDILVHREHECVWNKALQWP